MWVRGSCFSTCARPRVTLPYIHSLLDIPPTLSSYIVHTHTFIYTTRQLNFSCVYSCRLVRGSRRVSTGLLLSLYASPHWLHTCMRAVRMYVYICVCVEVGYDARRRQSACSVRKKTGTGLSSAQGKTGLESEHGGSRTMGASLSLPLFVTLSV